MHTYRKEASVTHAITTQLANLGWQIDEKTPECNVFQQRPKTREQEKKLRGKFPDFVLYQEGTNKPIGVIEAKRPGQSLIGVLDKTEKKYAHPLGAPLIFAYNDTYIRTRYLYNKHPLKIDGEDVRQFIAHETALRFIAEGSEILSVPEHIKYSREQLIAIFKSAANLLREAGLQAGLQRFGTFSDLLFLKIMDEVSELRHHAGKKSPIPDYLRWSEFTKKPAPEMHRYVKDVVWPEMNQLFGTIFSEALPIDSPEILSEIIQELSQPGLNLTASDTDVKGDAFEYFLKNAYQGVKIKDLGEYFTPRNVVRTMVSMVDPKIGEKIYDPFCGTGGFLIESFRYLRLRTKSTRKWDRILRNETVYGSEITTNARIAMMNMILYGDGHSNVIREDSLAKPKRGAYDIVLTNPPYSQKTRHGNLYSLPTENGDPICVAHCFDALNESGRVAMLVKEDFLTKGGIIGTVREYIMKHARNISVVSLPRRLFEPYTPTKTSILYFEKAGCRNTAFFYVVDKVGHTLGSRRRSIRENDLPTMLEAFNEEKESISIDSCVIDNPIIKGSAFSLWIYDYIERLPELAFPTEYLGKFIERSGEIIDPQEFPDEEFIILGVTYIHGVYENDRKLGTDIQQQYKRVNTGDLVYNPHRVNLGSIGIVTDAYNGGYVSPIYVVFRSIDERQAPPVFIWSLLKSEMYKRIIRAYDTRQGAVRPNLTWDQLVRIRIPLLPNGVMKQFTQRQSGWGNLTSELEEKQRSMFTFIDDLAQPREGSAMRTKKIVPPESNGARLNGK